MAAWDTLATPQSDFLSGFLAAELPFNDASRRIISNFVSLARRLRRS